MEHEHDEVQALPVGEPTGSDDDHPERTVVAGEWAGVFCIEDYRVFQKHIAYIDAVHGARTYGEARAAHPEEGEEIVEYLRSKGWTVITDEHTMHAYWG
ncbi:hypothetical protein [Planomonospora algeriensis]